MPSTAAHRRNRPEFSVFPVAPRLASALEQVPRQAYTEVKRHEGHITTRTMARHDALAAGSRRGALLVTVGCGAHSRAPAAIAAPRRRTARRADGIADGRELRAEPAHARAPDDGERRGDVAGRVRHARRGAGRDAQPPAARLRGAGSRGDASRYRAATPVRTLPLTMCRTRAVVPVSSPRPSRGGAGAAGRLSTSRVRPKRAVKKSAIIIGSSAGAGAGIGAAVGGKKGALIGAVDRRRRRGAVGPDHAAQD